jgi:hypothetical protein
MSYELERLYESKINGGSTGAEKCFSRFRPIPALVPSSLSAIAATAPNHRCVRQALRDELFFSSL